MAAGCIPLPFAAMTATYNWNCRTLNINWVFQFLFSGRNRSTIFSNRCLAPWKFMGKFNLNLSTRPFPAYRIVNLALMVSLVVIAGVTAWQVYSYRMYSDLVKSIQTEEKNASVNKDSLGTRMDAL